MTENPLTKIREFVANCFSPEEFLLLCFDHFPDLRKDIPPNPAMNMASLKLIEYCERHGRIFQLIEVLEIERPIPFNAFFSNKQLLFQSIKIEGSTNVVVQPGDGQLEEKPAESKSREDNKHNNPKKELSTEISPLSFVTGHIAGKSTREWPSFQENTSLLPTKHLPDKTCQPFFDQEMITFGGIRVIQAKINEEIFVEVRSSQGDRRQAKLKSTGPGTIEISPWHNLTPLTGEAEINKVYEIQDWPSTKHYWRFERLPIGSCIELNNECFQFLAHVSEDVWKLEHQASDHRPDTFIVWVKTVYQTEDNNR